MPHPLPFLAAISIMTAVATMAAEPPGGVQIISEYWASRDTAARVLLMKPARPKGGVLLLPGGHGNINLDVQAQIGWGRDDFLIRTRARYADSGLAVLIPDVAVDFKPPKPLGGYRVSQMQAQDLRAIADKLGTMVEKVWLVAYDRGAVSALNVIARGHADRFAGLVLISPLLEEPAAAQPTLDEGIRLALDKLPVLVIGHALDGCSAEAIRRIQQAGAKAQREFKAVIVKGGASSFSMQDPLAYPYDPCNREPSHAMAGLEESVTEQVLAWLTRGSAGN
jgi:pimeloyl-ACP methyl ester carboxylesterase